MAADKTGVKARVQTAKREPRAASVVKKVTPLSDLKKAKPADESRKVVRGVKRIVTPVKAATKTSALKPGVKRIIKLGEPAKSASEDKAAQSTKAAKQDSSVAPAKEDKQKAASAKENKQKAAVAKESKPKAAAVKADKSAKAVPKVQEKAAKPASKKRASASLAAQPSKKSKPVEEEELLTGFPDADSEDEDEEDDALADRAGPSVEEVVRLPSSRDDAVVRQRLDRAQAKHNANPDAKKGVVYVGRLPRGFEETQLRAYFSQFGDVERLRVSRNKKTGRSKHYAFIEFSSHEVAEIVVETMNNYLIDGHLLQMAMVPEEKIDPNLWIGAERKFQRVPVDRIERVRRTKKRSEAERKAVNKKLLAREQARRERLASLGIDYDFPGYQK
ncbi:nucleolar protein [Malassezia cuniculi]|uniref:Nucleolar protein n=1 Tax=Malassezia cuniculi TaxID=948313 RepID=A0AAF0EV77_9BASI|nr:nucleolar protein [Malassezia cuniculi]